MHIRAVYDAAVECHFVQKIRMGSSRWMSGWSQPSTNRRRQAVPRSHAVMHCEKNPLSSVLVRTTVPFDRILPCTAKRRMPTPILWRMG